MKPLKYLESFLGGSCPIKLIRKGVHVTRTYKKIKPFFTSYTELIWTLPKNVVNNDCPYCKGPCHQANYERKAMGAPEDIPNKQMVRQSYVTAVERDADESGTVSFLVFFGEGKKYWSASSSYYDVASKYDPNELVPVLKSS